MEWYQRRALSDPREHASTFRDTVPRGTIAMVTYDAWMVIIRPPHFDDGDALELLREACNEVMPGMHRSFSA
jgi:hypothetical protein